ncbi:MAG: bifunctional diaminohydroxyphosphoribosylaminopyrimidine deaminase/5-amino-6-(5-phosphoribosylamino)uracil reductase RibD [Candidatus Omnitrophota bacterium]
MKRSLEKKYMKLALMLAAKAKDKTYPNPMVGAVIVKGRRIVGKGYHHRAGENHAEINAIKDAGAACRGAAMFVTLEPCNHYGKTPPCTQGIIESGIKKVYAAMKDPNPITGGKGIRKLKKAGIVVNVGIFEENAKELNKKYIKFMTSNLPYVTVKLAQSIDGKIAARDGSSKWISSELSRKYVRKMRPDFDAIIVGANTAVNDDPFLLDEKRRGYNVSRIVIDSRLRMSLESNIIKTAGKAPVIIATTELAPPNKIKKFQNINGVEIIKTRSKTKKVSLKALLTKLAQKEMVNVLVEGGGELVGSLIDEKLVDEVMFFISPKIIGGSYSSVKGSGVPNIAGAMELNSVEIKKYGEDIFVRGMICSQA